MTRSLWKGPYISKNLLSFQELRIENNLNKSLFLKQQLNANLVKAQPSSPTVKKISSTKNQEYVEEGVSQSLVLPKEVHRNLPNKQVNPKKLYIWSRNSTILPQFTNKNHLIYVYDGKKFTQLRIVPEMIGHKFGEFALTRKYKMKR